MIKYLEKNYQSNIQTDAIKYTVDLTKKRISPIYSAIFAFLFELFEFKIDSQKYSYE